MANEAPDLAEIYNDLLFDVSSQLESDTDITPEKWTNEQVNAALDDYAYDRDGADPGDAVLQWAVTFNYPDTVAKVLTKGIFVNSMVEYDEIPYEVCALGLASIRGHIEIMELLLQDRRIRLEMPDMYLNTPLWLATTNGHKEAVEMLLSHGANAFIEAWQPGQPAGDECPLFAAIRVCPEKVLDAYIDFSTGDDIVNMEHRWTTPLMYAVEFGSVYAVRKLLDHPMTDVNEQGNQCHERPLARAIRKQHLELVEILLGHDRIDVDLFDRPEEQTVYEAAILEGNVDILRLLLESGADPGMTGFTRLPPLMLAIKKGKREMAELLAEDDLTEVDDRGFSGWTALILATVFGAYEMVKSILDVSMGTLGERDDNNLTALDHAEAILESLSENGTFSQGVYLQAKRWSDAWEKREDGEDVWDIDHSKTRRLLVAATEWRARNGDDRSDE